MSDEVVIEAEPPQIVIVDDDLPGIVIVEPELPDGVVVDDDPVDVLVLDAAGPGPRGDPGPSAYELWLGDGHAGSESDFLDWLKADAEDLLEEHIQDPTPHPAYDDMADMTLIFENHLI